MLNVKVWTFGDACKLEELGINPATSGRPVQSLRHSHLKHFDRIM